MGTLTRRGLEETTETTPDATDQVPAETTRPTPDATVRSRGTAVWVDGTSAIVVRWAGRPFVERIEDEVPAHHRSTGHVRHDPAVRHGGGGVVAEQVDRDRRRHRGEHLRRVERLVPATGPVLVLGPGSARLELERSVVAADRRLRRERTVLSEASQPMTDGELVARLRAWLGDAPRRRSVGRH